MSARLPSGLLVAALLKRVNDAGGFGAVLARGDAEAGGIVAIVDTRTTARALERGFGPDGREGLIESRRAEGGDSLDEWWQRRRARDPDLWVIELDIPDAERFVAETMGVD